MDGSSRLPLVCLLLLYSAKACELQYSALGDYAAFHLCPTQCVESTDVIRLLVPEGRIVDSHHLKSIPGTPGLYFDNTNVTYFGITPPGLNWDLDDGCLGSISVVSSGGRFLNISGFTSSCCNVEHIGNGVGLTVRNFYELWEEDDCSSKSHWRATVHSADGELRSLEEWESNTISASECIKDGAKCFSSDSTVQLASGATKTMADLQVGDSILSADAAGKLSYSDVAFLPHSTNTKATDFVKVTTESGKAVKATPMHLLQSCDGSLVQAKAAACLRTVNGDEAVTSIEFFKANGIYSAVTLDNEFLVVDGVVASPFALAHGLVNAYYNLHRAVYKHYPALMKMPAVVSANSLLAAGAMIAMDAVSASSGK